MMRRLTLLLTLLAALLPVPALAQSSCPTQTEPFSYPYPGGSVFGFTSPQWAAWFGAKADSVNGCVYGGQFYYPNLIVPTVNGTPLVKTQLKANSFSTVATAATVYIGTAGQSATEASAWQVSSQSGTLSQLYVATDAAPGTGNSIAVTVDVNDAAQSITCTISNSATSCSDTVDSATLTPGQVLDFKVVSSASANAARVAASVSLGN
jgi:hypothetical protein